NRTSYLLNSQLSHKTRRWGRWNLIGFINGPGTSNFISYVERDAATILNDLVWSGEPRQDDFDIWDGILNWQPWIPTQLHTSTANFLYLDGHAAAIYWPLGDLTNPAALGLFPDSGGRPINAVRDYPGFYATDTSDDDPWGGM
ncbi:MAG TPA: hypothetical protein VGL71_13065, partial [Urbifossiella sp.]